MSATEETKKATAATSETITELFHEGMRSYEKALTVGIQLQEESVNLWKDLLSKLGSPEEFQTKLDSMKAAAFPQARERMEEFVETFNRMSNQTIDLFAKTPGVYQATSITDAQRRVQDLIESSLTALRVNVHGVLNTNAKIIADWKELVFSQDEEHMNSFTLNPFTLTESSVVEILSPNLSTNTPVLLVAIDYNWGPPVSGRFDVDFLQLWTATKSEIGTKTVRLLGNYGPNHTWVDDLQFQHVRDCGERQLYLLVQQGPVGQGPDPLPTEFVIKLETADGQVYYDNNNGSNYRLKPYLGRGTSAVTGPNAIWIFEDFVNYRLLKRN